MQQDGGRPAPEELERGEMSSASSTEREPPSPRTCSRPSDTELSGGVRVKAARRKTSGKRNNTHREDHPQKKNNTTDLFSNYFKTNYYIFPPPYKIRCIRPLVTPGPVNSNILVNGENFSFIKPRTEYLKCILSWKEITNWVNILIHTVVDFSSLIYCGSLDTSSDFYPDNEICKIPFYILDTTKFSVIYWIYPVSSYFTINPLSFIKPRTEYLKCILSWKEITNCNKIELFKRMKRIYLNFKHESDMSPVNHHIQKINRISQFAFAVVVMKSGDTFFFHQVYPEPYNKKNKDKAKHSEEILMGKVDEFLRNKTGLVKHIVIYTYNSPCLQRKDGVKCCKFKLLDKASEWEEYGISTEVLFTKFWGLSGPKYFADLIYSSISDPHSDFYPYFETFKNQRYKFDTKSLKKIQSIFDKTSHEDDTKKENHTHFEKALETLTDSYCTCDEHLQNLRETLKFLPEQGRIKRIQKQCTEIINNSAMKQIRPKITADFNMFAVKAFEGLLGSSSPLQLRHISEEILELNRDNRLIALIHQIISEVKEGKANKQLLKSDKPPIDNLEVQQLPTTPDPTSLGFSVSFSDFNKKKNPIWTKCGEMRLYDLNHID